MNDKLFKLRIATATVCIYLTIFGIFLIVMSAVIDVGYGLRISCKALWKGCVAAGMFLSIFCPLLLFLAMPSYREFLDRESEREHDPDK